MAIKNEIITSSLINVISGTSSTSPVSVGIYLCNFSPSDEILNIYVRATGEAASNKNTILSNLLMLSGDTFHFPSEKFILSSGDIISASGRAGGRVSITSTFLNI
jgi:hypothetical protein